MKIYGDSEYKKTAKPKGESESLYDLIGHLKETPPVNVHGTLTFTLPYDVLLRLLGVTEAAEELFNVLLSFNVGDSTAYGKCWCSVQYMEHEVDMWTNEKYVHSQMPKHSEDCHRARNAISAWKEIVS